MTNVALRLLFYNTFLLRIPVPWPGGPRYVAAKPAVAARAVEIGRAVAGQYDLVAMSEVFDEPERKAVLAGWGDRPVTHVTGPPPPTVSLGRKGSGLFTVVAGPTLVRREVHTFRQRGEYRRDSDAFANKGVLMTEIDVGYGANLEVFSTHLIFGNDFLKRPGGHYGAVADVRQQQADELLEFVGRVHRPENVALVVGDFNVPAHDPEEDSPDRHHRRLRDGFDRAGFDDLWALHGAGPGYTVADERSSLDAVCRLDAAREFCVEPADPPPVDVRAARIDYAWLERPTERHHLAVSVQGVRRRSFPRAPGSEGYDDIAFLSDHLGLHLELALGPNVAAP